jgi:PAS domain S-box-containing protein
MNSKDKTYYELISKVLFENSPLGISFAKPDGSLYQVNLAYARMYGYDTPEKMLEEVRNVEVLYANPVDRKKVLRKLKINGLMEAREIEVVRRDGSRFFALVSASEIRNSDRKLLFNQATHIDLTEQKKTEKKMETELRESNRLLEELNKHLHNVWENEKSHIAMNLHDDLGQRLTALNLDLAWIKSRMGVQSSHVKVKLDEMSLSINETIESIKEISSLLRPAILFDIGLIAAINSQLMKFEKQSGMKCDFKFTSGEIEIDSHYSLIFYRIFQESLTNIARHSGAASVKVNLNKTDDIIELVISDDGIGIDKDKINSLTSMGIAGIKERAKLVNGRVSIRGKKGSGTVIKVVIPVKPVLV